MLGGERGRMVRIKIEMGGAVLIIEVKEVEG